MDKKAIGNSIKEIRKLNRLTQSEFAEMVSISQGNLSEIESGKIFPSLEIIYRIGKLFRIDLNSLLNPEVDSFTMQLSSDEYKIISLYRQLQDIAKEEVQDIFEIKLKRYTR